MIRAHRDIFDKIFLGLFTTSSDGVLDVGGEIRVHDDIIVKVVFQIFSAFMAAVAVEDAEDLNFRPVRNTSPFLFRLDDIQNDGDTVFVDFTHRADICIGCKWANATESFGWSFAYLEER